MVKLSKNLSGSSILRLKLPVKSSKLNVLIAVLGIGSLFFGEITAQSDDLTDAQYQWIAQQIFANECSRNIDCLTSWNAGEDFPSLGLGHFIWYRQGQNERYTETFPELIRWYHTEGLETPTWITDLPGLDSPWADREQFLADFDRPRLRELRNFLQSTLDIQTRYIIQRQEQALPRLLAQAPATDRPAIESLYREIAAADPPLGRYALIDYVNFKGEGINPAERYRDQGWGLLQVLETMLAGDQDGPVLPRFALAAEAVLRQRVTNAPPERNEQRWLAGWLNRLQTYLPH
jgi:hypothetical protein